MNPKAPVRRFRVRVVLHKLRILDDKDPLWCDPGEIRFRCVVTPGGDRGRARSTRLPTSGVFQMHAGEQVIERVVFDATVNEGETLAVELTGFEEDRLTPDDRFDRYRRVLAGDPPSWAGTYAPGDETADPEALADWQVWYSVVVEPEQSVIDLLPKNPADAKGVPGPLKRMAWWLRERRNASGLVPPEAWAQAQGQRGRMRRPDFYLDDPGGPAPAGDLRAHLDSQTAVLRPGRDPGTVPSFGNVGRFVTVVAEADFAEAALSLGLTPEEVVDVDPATLRLFRYHEASRTFQMVYRSGLGQDGTYVWGRIRRPGLYGVFGLPRDAGRMAALQALLALAPLAALHQGTTDRELPVLAALRDTFANPEAPFMHKILGDPGVLDQLGFPDQIGDSALLEGRAFGPMPRDPKGRPVGPRSFLPMPGPLPGGPLPGGPIPGLPLPGGRPPRGPIVDERCWTPFVPRLPERIIPLPLPDRFKLPCSGCPKWVSIGPANLAGRVKALAAHPTLSNVLYAAVSQGGVFQTNDGGATWFPRMQGELSLSMGAVAVAPSNPSVVYAGSGEYITANWWAGSSYGGVGVFRSTDGGADWDLMPPLDSDRIARIVVHPTNPNRIYVAGNGGVHRWNPGTNTWTRIFAADCSDIALDPSDSRRLFAGLEGPAGIQVTDDAEAATPVWQPLNNGLTLATHWPNPSFIKLAISRSNPAVRYALVNHEVQDAQGNWGVDGSMVYRWNGTTWVERGVHGSGTQRIWCAFVRVHPTDPERIYVGGVWMEWSPDGGATWHGVGSGHADNHDLAFDPTNANRTWICNDGGVWTHTQTAAETTWNYADANAKLTTIQFYNLGVSQQGAWAVGGATQDQGILIARNNSQNFDGMGGNEGGLFEIDPNDSRVVYWDPWDGNLTRRNHDGTTRDANNGIERLLDAAGMATVIPSIDSLAVHPADSNVLLCSAGGQNGTVRVYRSIDAAAVAPATGWSRVLDNAGSAGIRFAFAPSNPTVVYFITDAGLVFQSNDTGQNWARVSNATLPAGQLRGLAVDWDDAQTLYVTYGGSAIGMGHVWGSTNGGRDWRDLSGARPHSRLPDIYTGSVVVHKGRPETLYVCTDVGVFRSEDGGDWWYPFDDHLPNAVATDMEYQPQSQTLYVATIGRGIWKRALG